MVIKTKNHRIVLKPYPEIPLYERWLFDDKKAMKKLNQGLKDAAAGRITEKGNFVKCVDDID